MKRARPETGFVQAGLCPAMQRVLQEIAAKPEGKIAKRRNLDLGACTYVLSVGAYELVVFQDVLVALEDKFTPVQAGVGP